MNLSNLDVMTLFVDKQNKIATWFCLIPPYAFLYPKLTFLRKETMVIESLTSMYDAQQAIKFAGNAKRLSLSGQQVTVETKAELLRDLSYEWQIGNLNIGPTLGDRPLHSVANLSALTVYATFCRLPVDQYLYGVYDLHMFDDQRSAMDADLLRHKIEVNAVQDTKSYSAVSVVVPRPSMKIRPLGVGNADPKNIFGNSCFLLEADRDYLIDFPKVASPMFCSSLEQRVAQINDIFITHTHNDHIGSLVDFLLMRGPAFARGEKINVYAEQRTIAKLCEVLDILGLKTQWDNKRAVDHSDFINCIALEYGKTLTRPGTELKVDISENVHGDTPSSSFKFTYGNKRIGISGDCNEELTIYKNPPAGGFKTRFDDCDLIFHEVTARPNAVHTDINYLRHNFSHLDGRLWLYHVENNLNADLMENFFLAQRYKVYRV